jgi:single-strand DNA-binding protein
MKMIGLARLGADAEIRFTESGIAYAHLSLAFDYGKKDESGKRPTQWVRATMWGKRAEALASFLVKGTLLLVDLRDVHVREWQTDTKSGASLEGTVNDVEFAGGGSTASSGSPARPAAPARAAHNAAKADGYQPASTPALDNWDDDVPF